MTPSKISLTEQLAKLTLAVKIMRIAAIVVAALWFTVQIVAYIRFHEIPLVGWEFLIGAIAFWIFFSQKKAALQKQIADEAKPAK